MCYNGVLLSHKKGMKTGTRRNLEFTVLSEESYFTLLHLFHMQNRQIYTDSKLAVAIFGGGSDGDSRMRL